MEQWQYNRDMYDLFKEQLEQYPEMKRGLEDIFGKQKELFRTQYANKAEELGFQSSGSIYDFMTKYRGAQARSGFSGSGALEKGRERGVGQIQQGHEFGMQSLFDVWKSKELGAEKEYLGDLSALDKWRADLRTEMASMDTDIPGLFDFLGQALTDPIGGWQDIGSAIGF